MTKINYFAVSILLFIFFFLYIFLFTEHNAKKLSWDEVDYVKATEKGILENFFDFESNNFFKHFDESISKLLDKKKIKTITKNEIKLYKLENDTFKLRHFHPPLLNIVLSTYYSFIRIENDLNLSVYKKYSILNIFLLFLFFFYFSKEKLNLINFIGIVLILVIFFQTNNFKLTVSKINYHTLFGFTILFYLHSFISFKRNNNFINKLILAFSIFIIFFTLETALFVFFIPLLFFAIIDRDQTFTSFFLKDFSKVFVMFLIFLFILWPSNIYNLTFLKTYSYYFYRVFIMNYSEYSDLNAFKFLLFFIIENKIILSIFLLFLVEYFYNFKKNYKFFLSLLIFTIFLYSLFVLPFAHHPSYFFPVMILIVYFLCLRLIEILSQRRLIFFNLLFIFIIIYSYLLQIDRYEKDFFVNTNNIFNLLNKKNNQIYLVDGAHIFKYYFENNEYINLEVYDKYNPKFYIKFNNDFYDVKYLISQKYFDGIIIQKNRKYKKIHYQNLIEYGYKLDSKFKNYYFYY